MISQGPEEEKEDMEGVKSVSGVQVRYSVSTRTRSQYAVHLPFGVLSVVWTESGEERRRSRQELCGWLIACVRDHLCCSCTKGPPCIARQQSRGGTSGKVSRIPQV
jgi:hypothetical protein